MKTLPIVFALGLSATTVAATEGKTPHGELPENKKECALPRGHISYFDVQIKGVRDHFATDVESCAYQLEQTWWLQDCVTGKFAILTIARSERTKWSNLPSFNVKEQMLAYRGQIAAAANQPSMETILKHAVVGGAEILNTGDMGTDYCAQNPIAEGS